MRRIRRARKQGRMKQRGGMGRGAGSSQCENTGRISTTTKRRKKMKIKWGKSIKKIKKGKTQRNGVKGRAKKLTKS